MTLNNREDRGFTLIEVLVVLALAALLQTLAAPALSAMVDQVRVGSAAQTLHGSLQLARSEAIKRNGRVVVCKSADGLSCVTAGGWEQGWIVFHDRNNNATLDSGEPVLLQERGLPPSLRLTGNSQVKSYVSYTPLGVTQTPGGGFQAGTLTVCRQSASSTAGRQIIISSAGRVRTQKAELASCA